MMIHDARVPEKTMLNLRGRWFYPNARVGVRQHACSKPECQQARRGKGRKQTGARRTRSTLPVTASSSAAPSNSQLNRCDCRPR